MSTKKLIVLSPKLMYIKQKAFHQVVSQAKITRIIFLDTYHVTLTSFSYSAAMESFFYFIGVELNPEMNNTKIKNRDNPVCFQEPSFNELTINRKKFVGSAQVRRKGKLLQHGSILTGINTEKHSSCFKIKPETEDLRKVATYIDVPEKELKSAIKDGFSGYFNTNLNGRRLCNKELSEAKELARVKYESINLNNFYIGHY